MIVTYKSHHYAPDRVAARYVRFDTGLTYRWIEQDGVDKRYDLRQGTVAGSELPEDVRTAADERKGTSPGYVAWP